MNRIPTYDDELNPINYIDYAKMKNTRNKNNQTRNNLSKNQKNISTKKRNISGVNKKSRNNKNKYKAKFKKRLSVIMLSLGIGTAIFAGNKALEKDIDLTLDTYTIENQINETSLDSLDTLPKEVLEAAKMVINKYNLEKDIDLNNNYVSKNKGYTLDNYFLYQMVMGDKDSYDSYAELAFALPILNNKNVDKNSPEYIRARDILINNVSFLAYHAEDIAKDKLKEAILEINEDEVSEKKLETLHLLKEAAISDNIHVVREKESAEGPLRDIIYMNNENNEKKYIAMDGLKSGFRFLSDKNHTGIIDGYSAITNAANVRGSLIEEAQNHEYRRNMEEAYLKYKSDLSPEEIEKRMAKFEEKEKERYKNAILKNANLISKIDNTKITHIDLDKGKISQETPEKEYQEKNFANFTKDPNKTKLVAEIMKVKSNEEKELDYEDIEDREIINENSDITGLDEQDNPYDIKIKDDDFDRGR